MLGVIRISSSEVKINSLMFSLNYRNLTAAGKTYGPKTLIIADRSEIVAKLPQTIPCWKISSQICTV